MKKILFSIFIFSSVHAICGGIQTNLQGQKQIAMGHTGTGLHLDHASVFFNPGALSFLDSLRGISVGLNFMSTRTSYLEKHPGTYTAYPAMNVETPFTLYAVYKFKPKSNWNVGLGIYTPFVSSIKWPNDWKGQFIIREFDLKTTFIQPTLAVRVNKKMGIGLGFVYATGSLKIRKGLPIQDSLGVYGESELSGKANGFGFNGGIYFQATEKFSMGINYRSAVKIIVDEGTANFNVPSSYTDYYPKTTFSTGITLPQTVSLGLGYTATTKIKLALDVNFVGWQAYDSLIIDFTDNTSELKDLNSEKGYKNSTVFRLGGQYELNSKWTIRAGAYYDVSPAKAGYTTPETPNNDNIGISAGATLQIKKRLNMDFSILYIEGLKKTDTNIETQFSGTYKTKSFIPGVSLGYLF